MQPHRQSGTPTALQKALGACEAVKATKPRRKWIIQPVRLAAADRVAYPPGQRPAPEAAPRPRTPAPEHKSVPRARTPRAAPEVVPRAATPRRVTPPRPTSHATLAAKRARHLAAGDATPRCPTPAPRCATPAPAQKAPEERPLSATGARAVTPEDGARRDLRTVVYDAEKKSLLWQAPEGVAPVPYAEAVAMERPPRYVRAFYDVASGETCWAPGARAPADVSCSGADAASDACVDARGTAAPSPAASSTYSEAFEDDETFTVDDAEVGASCFFDDVCNTEACEKKRHRALDGGMEEMRRRIESMEVSLREGGICPA